LALKQGCIERVRAVLNAEIHGHGTGLSPGR
jgi:hypothetical protein